MLFWEEMKGPNSPPSYTEAMKMPASVQPSTSAQEKEKDLRPKLCKMEKTSAGYGFHLNGIEGVFGQYIQEVKLTRMSTFVTVKNQVVMLFLASRW